MAEAPADRPLTRRELREQQRREDEARRAAEPRPEPDTAGTGPRVLDEDGTEPEAAGAEEEQDGGAPEPDGETPSAESAEGPAADSDGDSDGDAEAPDDAGAGAEEDGQEDLPADVEDGGATGSDAAAPTEATERAADAPESGTESEAGLSGHDAAAFGPGPRRDADLADEAATVVLPAARRRREQAPQATPRSTGRAGRDLPMAIGVGLGLGALLIASLFIWKEAFVVFAVVAAGGGLWEFATALRSKDIRIPLLPLLVGSTGMLVSAYVAGPEALVVAFMLTAGGVFVWRVIDGGGTQALRDAGAGILAAAYIPFLASFAVLMIAAPDGPWRVMFAISLVVANDVGGYAAGVLFGKHPMAPSVSPKKSWEGAAGSAVLAALVGVGLMWWFFDGPLWAGAAIGLVTVAAATVGDLSESLIKRDLGLKDMGSLLPGHGGILDRLDSMLVAAPVVFGSLTLTLALAA